MPKLKKCTKCNLPTPEHQFPPRGTKQKRRICWMCQEQERTDKLDAARGARYQVHTLTKYNLDPWEYELMLDDQEGKCAICKQPPSNTRRLGVDHNHVTGKVRGLLCTTCNMGLGLFKDDPRLLVTASVYLDLND